MNMIYEELERRIEEYLKDIGRTINKVDSHSDSSFRNIAGNIYANILHADKLSHESENGELQLLDELYCEEGKSIKKYFNLLKNNEFYKHETNSSEGYLGAKGVPLSEVKALQSNPSLYIKKAEEFIER